MPRFIHPASRVSGFLAKEACISRPDLDEKMAKLHPERSIDCLECASGNIAFVFDGGASAVIYRSISEVEAFFVNVQSSKPTSVLEDDIGSSGGVLTNMFRREFFQMLEVVNIVDARLFALRRINGGLQDSAEFRFLLICAIAGNIARVLRADSQWYFALDSDGLLIKLLLMSEDHILEIGEEVATTQRKTKFSLRSPRLIEYLQIVPQRWRRRDGVGERNIIQLKPLELDMP